MENFYGIILNFGVYAPLACALIIACLWPMVSAKAAKCLALLASAITAAAGVALWASMPSDGSFNFFTEPNFCGIILPQLALNGVSAPLFALAGIVGFAAVWQACISEIRNAKLYFMLLSIMLGGLAGAFGSVNLLWMYAFHEFALVPTFIAMNLWGGAGRRMAAMQMAVYLTLGALVSLIGIIALFAQTGANDFTSQDIAFAAVANPISAEWQYYIFALLLFGLGTLVSLFPFYSWAPRAYASAPTAFAMLHAGVLKKFGLYVLIQVAYPMLALGALEWSETLAVLALFNVIFIGLVTMAQRDLKMMVAYSSVAHMGICFLGLATASVLGVGGAMILMFGHGASVALTLMLSTMIINRTGEWEMRKMGGLYRRAPILGAFFIAASFAGAGLPGFANFWGELCVLTSLWNFSPVVCVLGATGIIISAIYALRAIANIFMGEPSPAIADKFDSITDMTLREKIPAAILIVSLLIVGFFPKTVSEGLNSYLSNVATYAQTK